MKILFLQKRILFPTDTGGKIRTLNVVRYLAKWHDVTYLCNVRPEDTSFLEQMQALSVRLETIPWHETSRDSWRFYAELAQNVFSPYPYNVAKDYDRRLRSRARQLLMEEDFDLVVCDFVQMARNAIGLDDTPSILFQHNVEAEIFGRHAKSDSSWARRRYMSLQWRKMRHFEAEAGKKFNTVIAVSERDRAIFEQQYGWKNVRTIDTAVDVEYFQPNGTLEVPLRVVFLGSMDWLPNEDAVCDFAQNCWPKVIQACPDARFQIVGRNPTPLVRELSNKAGIEVVGTVPDVRPYLGEAAVVVVPLRIGGGTRIKIFEAMAMKKAVVSTTLGAEGLAVRDHEHIVLADDHGHFADEIVQLLKSQTTRAQLGANARKIVCEKFGAEKIARQFEAICLETAGATE